MAIPDPLHTLTATAAAQAIRDGLISSEELVTACLAQIDARDGEIQAWAFLDAEHALAQARAADAARQAGRPLGPLHGVPVGIKDIIDTADMPTECGTVLHAGRQPDHDATVVSRLRAAGAIILGKTVTTEMAVFHPGKTRNPHNRAHTPGGSSSGSAAAVAAEMVPLALGTQTNGSMIRPAAFCGVVGFKPTHGLIPRRGVLLESGPLDQIGVFARSVEDAALAAEVLCGYDEGDPDTRPIAQPPLLETSRQTPPVTPRIAFVRTPVWDQAEEVMHAAFTELVEALGEDVGEVELSGLFEGVVAWHRTIMEADLARNFAREYATGKERLSDVLCGMIERGQEVRAIDYNEAVARISQLNQILGDLFDEFDAIITPAAPGPAPLGLETTGSPIFCTLWTLLGTPAISLPLLQDADGMPMGVQLVGPRGDDARLLRTARWLTARVEKG